MEKERKGSSLISFKIIQGDQTKRINETMHSLKSLKNRKELEGQERVAENLLCLWAAVRFLVQGHELMDLS